MERETRKKWNKFQFNQPYETCFKIQFLREARPVIFICIREKWEMPSAGKKIHRAIREKKFKKKKLE